MAGQLKAHDTDSFDGAQWSSAKPATNDTAIYSYGAIAFKYYFLPFPAYNSKDGFWVLGTVPRTEEYVMKELMEHYILAQGLLKRRAGRSNEAPL